MPPKRKVDDTDFESLAPPIAAAAPPSLPPSVEEAYRRKCVQLKHRTIEVEESNDAARLRLARIKRQVEKLRMERAFLLEQLSKRTSTNVEDSDGSPSPPPTPILQDRPLRTKRGGRKTSGGADDDAKAESVQPEASPSKPSANGANDDDDDNDDEKADDADKTPFERYSDEQSAVLEAKGDDVDVEDELTKGWEALPDADKERYAEPAKDNTKKETPDNAAEEEAPAAETAKEDAEKPAAHDEDVEMRDDAEDQDTPMGKDE